VVYGGRIPVAAGIAIWTGRIAMWTGRVMVRAGLWPCEIMCRVLDQAYSGMDWTCGGVY